MPLPDVQPEWAKRMERKLDALLLALAQDEQDDERGFDLNGDPLPAERDPSQPL
jgi:hypothetical protein